MFSFEFCEILRTPPVAASFFGRKFSRMNQLKFLEHSCYKNWSDKMFSVEVIYYKIF